MQNKFVIEASLTHATIFAVHFQEPPERKPDDATLGIRVIVDTDDIQAYWREINYLGEPVWVAFSTNSSLICSGVRVNGESVVAMLLRELIGRLEVPIVRDTPSTTVRHTPSGAPVYDLGTLGPVQ